MSALLTTTMPMMEESIKRIKGEVKPAPVVLIGGAPVTQEYADKIGADGFAPDASSAVRLTKKLIGVA
jgi:methanogenic corrinoid protein MtbC1